MTQAEQLAAFIEKVSFDDLSQHAVQELKIRVLDGLGCAMGALEGAPVQLLRKQIEDFGGADHCTLIGGGRTAPDRASLYNSFLIRYLDFNDSYLAPGETCHPSDNIGAVLSAAEFAHGSGQEFLAALAVAYQVQCRLSDLAPVRARGFDHTTQGSYGLASGISKALRLDRDQTAHAIAICGTAFNALRVARTGPLSHWKGLAYPNTAFGCTHSTFLAMRGITGPLEVFEGNKGFMEAISGRFEIDWSSETVEKVTETILKKYNAEIHSQSAIEAVLELKEKHGFSGAEIEGIDLETFDVAYNIIGGGEEGDKTRVRTKEEADHSLPYILAVAVLDGQVMPEQYQTDRILRPDVQELLRRVKVRPSENLSRRFPKEMPCRLSLRLRGGRFLNVEKRDYEGFRTRPMLWETVTKKFAQLSAPRVDRSLRGEIIDAVAHLDTIQVTDLTESLGRVRSSA